MAITGRTVVAMLVGIVAVVLRPITSTVGWWVLLVAALVVFDVLAAPSPRRLLVRRDPVPSVRLGLESSSTLHLTNPGSRRMRLLVRDAWTPSAGAPRSRARLRLSAGASGRVVTPLAPTRRGDRPADLVTVRSMGPLGLAARQQSFDCPGAVRGLPAFPSRRHLPSRMARLQQIEGRATVRLRGQGTEFDTLRDYVRGDDVRSIDWRATARRRALVVRTWRPERDRRIVIVLDTSRVQAARVGDAPRLDAAMDAALLLTALAERAGDRVGLVAGDAVVRTTLPALRTDALARVSDALADLEPVLAEANWAALAAAVTHLGRRHSLVVLLTGLEPAVVEESLAPALSALVNCGRVVIASVSDAALDDLTTQRDTAASVHRAAAAEQTRAGRELVGETLGAMGVTVIDAPPADLPVRLVDHYLALKSHGLL